MKKKIVSLVLVFALALALGIGGTLAWLTVESGTVTNTFTIGDINIVMDEDGATGDKDKTKAYDFVPGATLDKRPTVKVEANSEACWLFVKVTATNNTVEGLTGDVIEWTVDQAEGWKPVDGVDNVWYIQVSAETAKAGKIYDVLEKDQVTVNSDITKKMADDTLDSKKPQLSFTAYAIQSANLKTGDTRVETAAQAWALIPASN